MLSFELTPEQEALKENVARFTRELQGRIYRDRIEWPQGAVSMNRLLRWLHRHEVANRGFCVDGATDFGGYGDNVRRCGRGSAGDDRELFPAAHR